MLSKKVRCADNQQAISNKISDEYLQVLLMEKDVFMWDLAKEKIYLLAGKLLQNFI